MGAGKKRSCRPRSLPHLRPRSDSPGTSPPASLSPQGRLGRNLSLGSGCHGAWPLPPPSFLLQSHLAFSTGTANQSSTHLTCGSEVWPPALGRPQGLHTWSAGSCSPKGRRGEAHRAPAGFVLRRSLPLPHSHSAHPTPASPYFLGNPEAASSELNSVNPDSMKFRLPGPEASCLHRPLSPGSAERPAPECPPSRRFWNLPAT